MHEAEATLAAAHAQREKLTEALRQAEQTFAEANDAAGIGLSRQILEGVVPTEIQEQARQARASAYLHVGDLKALVHKQEEEVIRQAEAALDAARDRLQAAQFNANQLEGPALAAQLEATRAQYIAAIEALLAHDAERLRLGVALGIGDVLAATPFTARVTEPRLPIPVNGSGWGLLNQVEYELLEKILPIPLHDPHSRSRIRGVTLDALSEAFSVLLELDQDLRLGGDRRHPTSLKADPSPEARNVLPLAAAGLPGMISTFGSVVLTAAQFQALHTLSPSSISEGR